MLISIWDIFTDFICSILKDSELCFFFTSIRLSKFVFTIKVWGIGVETYPRFWSNIYLSFSYWFREGLIGNRHRKSVSRCFGWYKHVLLDFGSISVRFQNVSAETVQILQKSSKRKNRIKGKHRNLKGIWQTYLQLSMISSSISLHRQLFRSASFSFCLNLFATFFPPLYWDLDSFLSFVCWWWFRFAYRFFFSFFSYCSNPSLPLPFLLPIPVLPIPVMTGFTYLFALAQKTAAFRLRFLFLKISLNPCA